MLIPGTSMAGTPTLIDLPARRMPSMRPVFGSLSWLLLLCSVRGILTTSATWCLGKRDGVYPNLGSSPPCSEFILCQSQQLLSLHRCSPGLCFSERERTCTAPCSCQDQRLLWSGPVLDKHRHLTLQDKMRGTLENSSTLPDLPRATRGQQINALLAFRDSNIDPAGVLSSWFIPKALQGREKQPQWKKYVCKHWQGISCDPVTLEITGITLNNPNFNQCLWGNPEVGQSIPPQFGDLTALQVLDLGQLGYCTGQVEEQAPSRIGGLIGSIPSELGRCSQLSRLVLNNNRLEGSLPESLFSLVKLQHLDISFNNFNGSISELLGNLTGLTILELSSNRFSGPLPEGISELARLSALKISDVSFSGALPQALWGMPSLTYLSLSLPQASGTFPDWPLPQMANLVQLQLQGIRFGSPLPGASWWTGLPSLRDLRISQAGLRGRLPDSLGPNIMSLDLSDNNITGQIPPTLVKSLCAAPTGTESLILRGNQLSGPIPDSMAMSPCLTSVDLSDNQLSGVFPRFISSNFTGLYNLKLSHNRLAGHVPRNAIVALPGLSSINLSHNLFSGPPPLITCGALNGVLLAHNFFSGELAKAFPPSSEQSCNMETVYMALDLSHNNLWGRLPRIPQGIISLMVQGNKLSGPFPQILNCSQLQVLNASGNGISGSIPSQLLNECPELLILDLSGNNITGPFPTVLPRNTSESGRIHTLSLAANQISGNIPSSVHSLIQLTSLNVSTNRISGPLPSTVGKLPLLASLDASSNALVGAVPSSLVQLQFLKTLNLSHNQLASISLELIPANFPKLRSLDLSRNSLQGVIPFGFATSCNTTLPVSFDLSQNNFSGAIPEDPACAAFITEIQVEGNPFLCGGAGYLPCPHAAPVLSTGAIVGIVLGTALVCALAIVVACKSTKHHSPWDSGVLLEFTPVLEDEPLTAQLLVQCTDNFGESAVLGKGGFGMVYRATLPNGVQVAVKRLAANSSQGNQEFRTEVQMLGSISHANIVGILAAYIASPPFEERLLVYRYLPGGSLDRLIRSELPKDHPFRSWDVRKSIALDVARGLSYLHAHCDPPIVHRDMKPANVLLDNEYQAHVADFGLARSWELNKSHGSTVSIMGTAGYIAPEYASLGRFSTKSDVFAYGVTLLQLLTGREPADENVAERGWRRFVGSLAAEAVADPRLSIPENSNGEVLAVLQLAVSCISKVPIDRPDMSEVEFALENLKTLASKMQPMDPVP